MVDNGFVTITAGGGGIPVVEDNGTLKGVAAVIDKDFAAAKVAELIHADKFIILTAVDKVMINYKKDNQESLDKLTLADCDKHIADGQFAAGSMLPKIEAAMSFVKSTGISSFIGSLENAAKVIAGESGTEISK
ncbi:hypothetical protein Zmor_008904 [Zophobas morio]|uniref:Aspartate/glutamate/uridylate kinase domain-containing protein n=1 Tax=Zophobas morio TaxID=2755281 RepID=A0AA38HKU6_9CUCU|nr:hypothetical protein Zmor_008904 [Zophobas morio]